MPRRALVICLALAAALAATAAIAHGQGTVRPPLKATLAGCETGTQPTDRYAVFTGSMPSGVGVASMAMRFELFERTPGTSWTSVSLPRWGVWERTTRRNVPGFIFTKRVEALAAPAAFRAVVHYRWFDAKGALLRSARRVSPVCHQPDPRPDLHVRRVIFSGSKPTRVVVRNRGRGDAGPFTVSVTRNGVTVDHAVSSLPAGAQEALAFRIGRCTAGEPIQVTLDSANTVDEADEADDAVTVACPE